MSFQHLLTGFYLSLFDIFKSFVNVSYCLQIYLLNFCCCRKTFRRDQPSCVPSPARTEQIISPIHGGENTETWFLWKEQVFTLENISNWFVQIFYTNIIIFPITFWISKFSLTAKTGEKNPYCKNYPLLFVFPVFACTFHHKVLSFTRKENHNILVGYSKVLYYVNSTYGMWYIQS